MRIERLDLSPYGRFVDRSLRLDPGAALHVALGRNESGKTTTLIAIGDLLFGFPRDTPYAFEHDQRDLRIGGLIRLAGGAVLDIRRRKGNKGTLLDPENRVISEEPLRAALGVVDRPIFETEFGLTALGLRRGGEALLRAGGSLAETLAAGSAALSALNTLRQRLDGEAEALFTARRSGTKPFYVALERHETAAQKLRDAIVTGDELKKADDELREARAHEVDLKALHQEQGRAIARRRRAARVAGKLRRLDELAIEFIGFADLPNIPAEALEAARAAFEADRLKGGELEKLAADAARDAAARAGLELDEALLTQGEAIDTLREQLGATRKAETDLPNRLGAQAQALSQLDDLARRLGLADHAALLAFAPADAALARLRALIGERRAVETRRAEAERRHAAAVAERARLGEVGETETIDPAPLKRRLDGFADVLRDAERLGRERALATVEERALAEEVASLDPAIADSDALARLPLPDEKALERRERAESAADEATRAAETRREAARLGAEAAAADLSRHERASAGATRADWDAARASREAALDRLSAALAGPDELRAARFELARALVHAADETAERLLGDAQRATRLQGAREALALRREELAKAEAAGDAAREARAGGELETQMLWLPCGIDPREPSHMTRWRARVGAILLRRADLARKRAESEALAARVAAARGALSAWLAEAGAPAPAGETFEEWHRAARARLDALQETKQAAAESAARRAQAAKAVAEWAAERDHTAAEVGRIAQAWTQAAAALRLAPETGVEEAEAALDAWAATPLPRREFEDAGHRIETMRTDIARFEREVEAVVTAAAPSLAGTPGREALTKLAASLALARKAADERARLDEAARGRALAAGVLEAERAAHRPALAQACALAGVAPEELATALTRLEARRALESERTRLLRELIESGDGLDEVQLREEGAGFDHATLAADLDVAELDQTRLLNEIGEAAAAARAAEAKREALAKGRDAGAAARERVEAADELVELAERWLARAAAAKLAQRAIERHRAAAQDPLIARAGELFAVATAGGFSGLAVGYDEADHPMLVARRASGQIVEIKGLSEGARDQLFLSLRLALLERRAGEPLPFIGDDLLASFDDERTRHTLGLLAEFGASRQTILFTHHARVAEIAAGLTGRAVEVIEM